MSIISISGKIGSGKDTVGKIIQIITDNPQLGNKGVEEWLSRELYKGKFEIQKWADSLKDIVCILIGCTREQLEDHKFKDTPLGEEWIRYSYADGFYKNYFYKNGEETMTTVMNAIPCSKERYEEELRVNWQTAYKVHYTPRLILQHIGTDLFRHQLHPQVWVNALMSKYKPSCKMYCARQTQPDDEACSNELDCDCIPDWIITDTRFPNEQEAVKGKGGISIRVNRFDNQICNNCGKGYRFLNANMVYVDSGYAENFGKEYHYHNFMFTDDLYCYYCGARMKYHSFICEKYYNCNS